MRTESTAPPTRPGLVFFHSNRSGRCRRVDGFLAQILQRRHNHDTFTLYRVDEERRPDLVERFAVSRLPTLLIVEAKLVRGRLVAPATCADIETFLAPWLR